MSRKKDKRLKKLLAYIHTLDAKEILDDLNIHYTSHGKNVSDGWIGVQCPFCDDHSNHLGVNLQSKSISCFSCGEPGTIIKLISRHLGYNKAVEYLLNNIPKELVSFAIDKEKKETINKVILPEAMIVRSKRHWNYIKKVRKFNPKKLFKQFRLQCILGTDDEYPDRIFVPIYFKNRLVTFTTIDINKDSNQRYLHNSEDNSIIQIKHLVYGVEYTNQHECIVVEGLFDKWRLGFNAVTPFGTKITQEQIAILKNFKRVKLCYDGDEPGRKASAHVASQLSVFTEVIELFLPSGDDPDKLSEKDIEYIKNY